MPNANEPQEYDDDQSTRPQNWPGIPGREEKREASEEEASVTRAQRNLEKEVEPNRQEPNEEMTES
jgi:hypothetical protein